MKFSKTMVAVTLSGMLAIGVVGGVIAQAPGDGDGRRAQSNGGRHWQHHPGAVGLVAIARAAELELRVFIEGGDGRGDGGAGPRGERAGARRAPGGGAGEPRFEAGRAVANGRIDQPRADEIYANAEAKRAELMNAVPERRDGGHHHHPFARGLIMSVAATIGVEPRELVEALKGGDETIGGVATANGVDPQPVIDNAVGLATARIDRAVEAERITAEKGAELKATAAERIAQAVNEGRP